MRLTVYSDYSLRLLMYAALHPDERVTIQQVSEAYGISRNHMMKVAFDLGRHGFLETVRGRGGGLRLARPPQDIRLGEVVRCTEEDFTLVECFDPRTDRCAVSGFCRIKGALSQALKAYLAVLDEYTLADLTQNRAALAKRLLPA